MDRECAYCGKLFTASRARKKYCSQDCYHKGRVIYKPCEYCGKMFNPEKKTTQFCSEKCYGLSKRSLPEVNCPTCGKTFRKTKKTQKYCSRLCVGESKKIYKNCERCGNKYNPERNTQKYCSYKCSAKAWANVYWGTMSPEDKDKWLDRLSNIGPNLISKINKQYAAKLEQMGHNAKLEFRLGIYQYDIKIGDNILIEINPRTYHNSTRSPSGEGKKNDYHYNKVRNAINNGYKCIIVRDWTTDEELYKMINTNFDYGGIPALHRYNPKTAEHILDDNYNREEMLSKGFVEIYDAGEIIYSE